MLIESITLAQRDNKELEALIYRFRPLIRKCGRQLHIIGPDISAGFTYGEGAYCYFSNVREKHKCSGYRTALGM